MGRWAYGKRRKKRREKRKKMEGRVTLNPTAKSCVHSFEQAVAKRHTETTKMARIRSSTHAEAIAKRALK